MAKVYLRNTKTDNCEDHIRNNQQDNGHNIQRTKQGRNEDKILT